MSLFPCGYAGADHVGFWEEGEHRSARSDGSGVLGVKLGKVRDFCGVAGPENRITDGIWSNIK